MTSKHTAPNKALMFATGWIARNVENGPFSLNDPPIFDGPISIFRKEAVQAGFSEGDLELAIGPVPAFIAQAYADAVANWHAANHRTDMGQ